MEKTPENQLPKRNVGDFVFRHIGPRPSEIDEMLQAIGTSSLDSLIEQTVPQSIKSTKAMELREALSEPECIALLRDYASQNKLTRSMIGQGYYDTYTPPVILRNIFENPAWYTAYTPYQAEISQGRLEALLNFQTLITELTSMQLANASLLDEGTAAAEAVSMAFNIQKGKTRKRLYVDQNCFPQTLEVLQTRMEPLGIEIQQWNFEMGQSMPDFSDSFAVLLQYPGRDGSIWDIQASMEKIQAEGGLAIVAADLAALCLIKAPGEMGADIVVGSSQRFGVPMGYGGPHAGYLATREKFKRLIPGRIVGVSKDSKGQNALRLALQTREQHIRRERATSNICTAQVLLAVISGMYAVYHGPKGLKAISKRIAHRTSLLLKALESHGFTPVTTSVFDTIELSSLKNIEEIKKRAEEKSYSFFFEGDRAFISCDETTSMEDLTSVLRIFTGKEDLCLEETAPNETQIPCNLGRDGDFLQQSVFSSYHSETELLRYMYRLQQKDLSLTHSMIPLGSCTMKLNGTTEMAPVTWPEFSRVHPFAPNEQNRGYLKLIRELEHMLAEISGFHSVSLQPNAGSQGEYAGLLAIKKFHESSGQAHRKICLIPSSAHGTNPASAVMAGMKVVVVACDAQGNIDIEDLSKKTELHKDELSALMITYPSTHGVFEENVREICQLVHDKGGQVYMDGANTNAMIGLCKPGDFGPDVMHFNLHKTFCIPHGGGGPGIGPIGVAKHLSPFLPSHSLNKEAGPETGVGAISAAPFGSASILPISWSYMSLMGPEGLKLASEVAILNANYIATRLKDHFEVLYKGKNNRVAHECIIDTRDLKVSTGITVDDIAKRLMDYGFHAPTMSWPVVGTLMIEPTESESKEELDRFCEAMISIREEIKKIESGEWSKEDNPLVNAPHTQEDLMEDWQHSYTRKTAFYPLKWVKQRKFWIPVNRVDNAYGDKNLMCSCAPLEDYS